MKLKRFFAVLTGMAALCVALFSGCTQQPSAQVLWDIEITSMPDKTEYVAGEVFDATGMQVMAVYYDEGSGKETRADVTSSATVPSEPLTAGQTEVVVRYSEGDVTKTEAVPVTVREAGTPGDDYGTLTIADMHLYNQFPSALLMITFSNPAYAETITYSYDSWQISIRDNVVRLLTDVAADTQVTVTATTEHHTAVFTVFMSPTFAEHDAYVPARESVLENRQESGLYQKGGVIFGGDSFFDIDFWADFYTDYSGRNAALTGIGGSRADEWIVYAERLIYPFAPSAVVLNIGTNDLGRGEAVDTVVSELEALFTRIHANLPDAKVCWYTLAPRGDTTALDASIPAVNAAIAEWAQGKEWFTLLDAYSQFTDGNGNVDWSMLKSDKLHPQLATYNSVYMALLQNAGVEVPARA